MQNLQELCNIVVGVTEMLNRLHEADLQYAGPLQQSPIVDEILNILYRKIGQVMHENRERQA
jgi:hypothetical protein